MKTKTYLRILVDVPPGHVAVDHHMQQHALSFGEFSRLILDGWQIANGKMFPMSVNVVDRATGARYQVQGLVASLGADASDPLYAYPDVAFPPLKEVVPVKAPSRHAFAMMDSGDHEKKTAFTLYATREEALDRLVAEAVAAKLVGPGRERTAEEFRERIDKSEEGDPETGFNCKELGIRAEVFEIPWGA